MSVTTAIVLDKRWMYQETKTFRVCVRVTYQRDHRRYGVGIDLTEADFNKLESPRLGDKLKQIKERLDKEEERAKNIIKNLNKFSFSTFGEQFNAFQKSKNRKKDKLHINGQPVSVSPSTLPAGGAHVPRANFVNQFGGRKYPREKSQMDFESLGEVAVFYGLYIARLEAKDQAGTVGVYMSSLASLTKYRPQLRFADVTDMWLFRYEKDMKAAGLSVTTIGIYLRCLRRIFNLVIAKKIISRDLYPFGRDLYVIPASRKRKKALNMAEIQALFEYKCDDETKRMCKDLWFFMYVGNGMNVKDMCLLKYEQISDKFCRFIRAKTVNTTRENQQEITFFCDDFILEVIARWGNKDRAADNYIFPFLTPGLDGYGIRYKVQLITHLINSHMYEIAGDLGFSLLPGTNDARHACATQLKRAGQSTEFIRELLGHHNAKTTQDYFDDFEDETKANVARHLLPFRENVYASNR